MDEYIKKYFHEKGWGIVRETSNEILIHCVMSDCDADSTGEEAHMSVNKETGLWQCFKCGASGNMTSLCKHFKDDPKKLVFLETSEENTEVKINHKKPTVVSDEEVQKYKEQIPDRIKDYLTNRLISEKQVDERDIGYGSFYGWNWITIPVRNKDGKCVMLKLRRDPQEDGKETKQPKSMVYPKGAQSCLYGLNTLKSDIEHLFVCEGEFDQMLLQEQGLSAVTSTNGCKTFKSDWCENVPDCKNIYVVYDNDEPGKSGAERTAKILSENTNANVSIIDLPKDVGEGGDITNYFQKGLGKAKDLIKKYAKSYESKEQSKKRAIKLGAPEQQITFDAWKAVIEKNFPELAFPAELCLSVIAQILIKDVANPFALVLVDVPASGKTITLNFFTGLNELVYPTDKFSPASFVSNAANVKKEKLSEVDLLPRIRYKTLIVRDFATLFSKREEDLNDLLGTLTRVLDGEGLNTDSGIHGQRKYEGDYLFMMLAASTPIRPRVWKIMGNLGGRLFFLKMNSKEKSEEELSQQIVSGDFKQKESLCRDATQNFLKTLWEKYPNGVEWNSADDPRDVRLIIARCAKLLARLRGTINIYTESWSGLSDDNYKYTTPVIEKPDRLNQLLYNLARGHALVRERKQISHDDMHPVIELCVDSAPRSRSALFRHLLDYGGTMKTSEVESELNCSKPTALKEMETLRILGVGDVRENSHGEKELILSKDLEWFLSDECGSLRNLKPSTDTVSD